MLQLPKLSVCMITYGHENYIRQAIEGVLIQQCNFELELIISNDCSPDNTNEIIEQIIKDNPKSSIIKYIKQKRNIGMMPNFIFSLQQCKGKYIALCEGDDFWTDPLKLQKQVDFLETNPEYILSFHKVDILKTDGNIVDDFITSVPENYENIETLARLGNYIHTPSVVFRNVIKEFPFEFKLTPIGDFFLYMIIAQHGKLKYFSDVMAVYRHGSGVLSSQKGIEIKHNTIRFYSFLLSYLNEEYLRKIILERQLKAIENYHFKSQFEFSSNQYLSSNKSFLDILKISIRKIFRKY